MIVNQVVIIVVLQVINNQQYQNFKYIIYSSHDTIKINKFEPINSSKLHGVRIRNRIASNLEDVTLNVDSVYTPEPGKDYKPVTIDTGNGLSLTNNVTINMNGLYTIQDYNQSLSPVGTFDAFTSVDVNIPQKRLETLYVSYNGAFIPYNDDVAYNRIEVNVSPSTTTLDIINPGNGEFTYNAPDGMYYSSVKLVNEICFNVCGFIDDNNRRHYDDEFTTMNKQAINRNLCGMITVNLPSNSNSARYQIITFEISKKYVSVREYYIINNSTKNIYTFVYSIVNNDDNYIYYIMIIDNVNGVNDRFLSNNINLLNSDGIKSLL